MNGPEVNVDTNRIALDFWTPHPPAHVRVYRENKCFDENAAIQGDVVEVDRLGLIVNCRLAWNGVPYDANANQYGRIPFLAVIASGCRTYQ